MSRTLRRATATALVTAGVVAASAGAAPGVAAAQDPEPCYIHGGSKPFLTCIVDNAIWRVEQIIKIW